MKGEQTLPDSNRGSGSRRTRSQVAPDWTETDLLILVNEITAVEADCRKEFSSFQKWKIVAQNCTALGVPRSLDQYRRKWEALLHDYKIIRHWNSQSRASASSYWALETDRRKHFGLPRSFDHEVFKAIGGYEKVRESQSDTETETETAEDSEPEGEADVADDDDDVGVVEPESKKRRRPSTQQKCSPIQNSAKRSMAKRPGQKARQMRVEEKTIVKPVQTHVAEKPGEKPRQTHEEEEPVEKACQTHAEKIPVEKPCEIYVEGELVKNPPKTYPENNVVGKSCQTHAEGNSIEKPHQTHVEGKHVEGCIEAIPTENLAEKKPVGSCLDASPMTKLAEEMPQKRALKKKSKVSEEHPGGNCLEELNPMKSMAEKKTLKSGLKRKQQNTQMEENITNIIEQEQIMAMKLQWSADLIRAIVTENADHHATEETSTKELQADLVRRQGDQVIACLADIVKTLNQVHHLVQERK
ncbi:uncharacterized protein LOC126783658 [Argentina anserina]|uniref:uncharacterized protein LOC126783658 n=1 Tax=Argentina anserina TaxID=57926 RepID=UPI0021765D55|nr:uncharacterized protein LOC126783658 [Potentilla anserina]